jgi:KDO2-lipid IV(A) lauroyltransferase
MKKDFITDYLGYILFRLFAPLIRNVPLRWSLFLGRRLGELLYYFDFKHKSIAYSNIKTALGNKLSPLELSSLTKDFYLAFGQNLIEVFFIPLVDKEYINKYISIQGLNYIEEGFKKGKGVILLGIHAGSWELSNIICANLGFPFILFIRNQRHPRLNSLLNIYRSKKGCRIIQRKNQTRQLIQALKENQAVGMTTDQGGSNGVLVKFFGKEASMPIGALRLALKYDATILPAFYTRVSGPYIKVIIEPPFKLQKTGDLKKDIHDNLQALVHIFEKYILRYPKEYLWSYKIWKYTKEKNILILNDSKVGHLRQSEALAKIVSKHLKDKDITSQTDTLEVKFKTKFSSLALTLSSCLSGKFSCQGCLWCLRKFLRGDVYKKLIGIKTDIIISCGSSLALINFILSRENLAKSIVIMRPSILSTKRFDLVIMPKHDNPPRRDNVVVTDGALNLIDEDYLKEVREKFLRDTGYGIRYTGLCIGLLIGGDTKNFHLKEDTILDVVNQIKSAAEKLDAQILVTTSRRTSSEVEQSVKKEFKNYFRCKLTVIANEENPSFTVGAILGLSQILVTSCESISMISEAVSSKKYVLVFKSAGLRNKHQRFLEHFAKNNYIYLSEPSDLSKMITEIWQNRPLIHFLRDNIIVSEAIRKIL